MGQFLEQLDDTAGKVADERLLQDGTKEDDNIASILAARGLEQDDNDDDEDEEKEKDNLNGDVDTAEEGNGNQEDENPMTPDLDGGFDPNIWPEQSSSDLIVEEDEQHAASVSDSQHTQDSCPGQEMIEDGIESTPTSDTPLNPPPPADHSESMGVPEDDDAKPEAQQPPSQFNMTTPFRVTGGSILSNIKSHLKTAEQAPLSSATFSQSRELQKEAKTLKRHVVKLNSQLEQAEIEIQAQREELERAAERIEKDRTRYQQEKDAEKKRHHDEVQLLKRKQEEALEEAKIRSNTKLEEARRQFRELEQRRMQEGGDMDKELSDAVEREQEFMQKISLLEDEKTTFLSQIGILQAQQEALGSRLESLSQTADNAMAREREAEDRLDNALSLHARQISQRNNRESELERTVAELGAALVEAKATVRTQFSEDRTTAVKTNDNFQHALTGELEALQAHLALEKQKCDTLQRELRSLTRERTDEVALAATRQIESDRKVQEMSNEISQLRRELGEAKELTSGTILNLNDTGEMKTFSEDLLRQRELVISCKSEISTLKSRLRAAITRAEKAEDSLEMTRNSPDGADDVELGTKTRLRGRLKKKSVGGFHASMSSALFLNSAQNERSTNLGKGLDMLDTVLLQSGTVLRFNPIARLFFSKLLNSFDGKAKSDIASHSVSNLVSYLLLLHSWTFVLFFFHAHGSFESINGCSSGSPPHGPHSILQNSPSAQKP